MGNSKYKEQLKMWIDTQQSNIDVQESVIVSQEKEILLKQKYLENLKALNALDIEMLNGAKKEFETL